MCNNNLDSTIIFVKLLFYTIALRGDFEDFYSNNKCFFLEKRIINNTKL